MQYKSILFIVCMVLTHALSGEGFAAGTLVKAFDYNIPIEEIRVGDTVDSWSFVGQTTGKVTALRCYEASTLIRLVFENDTLICGQDQLFFLSNDLSWRQAQVLVPGDRLKSRSGKDVLVVSVEPLNETQMVYEIAVEDEHNFYVSKSEVLAHNMVMVLAAAPAAAPVISGAVVLTAVKTAAAVSFVAGCFYSLFWSSDSKDKSKQSSYSDGGQNNRCKCGHYCGVGCGCECTSCGCWNSANKFSKNEYTYEHGKYDDAGYHHKNSRGNSRGGKSPAPKDGQKSLDNSVKIPNEGYGRVGVSEGQIVILSKTLNGIYHGHVISWTEFSSKPYFSKVFKEMLKKGFIDKKGNVLK